MKYVFVYGGVFSGLGKGVVTASIARLLKASNLRVSVVKIDPYFNYDAGTLRPTEHGEVWVTWEGVETDMDLGTYERFLNQRIGGNCNLTSGKVFGEVIEDERKGKYLGRTVQLIPHVVEKILEKISEAAENSDVVVVEVGGVVGDYENIPYLLAARLAEMGERNDVIHVLVVYFPIPPHLGEMKTKPAQHAIRQLFSHGITPDVVIGRAPVPLDGVRKEKIERTTGIPRERVISLPDLKNIYEAPVYLKEEGITEVFRERWGLPDPKLSDWEERLRRMEDPDDEVRIVIAGKYVKIGDFELPDSYVSILEALKHAWAETGVRPEVTLLDTRELDERVLLDADGVIVPGGFGATGVEGKIRAVQLARENDIPFLGLCYGMQLAVVEFARNVAGLEGAHTTEVEGNTPHPVIDVLPEQAEVLGKGLYGGTMRLGEYAAHLIEGSLARRVYEGSGWYEEAESLEEVFREREELYRMGKTEKPFIFERHRHRYEVNPRYIHTLEDAGLVFSGIHVRYDGVPLVEFVETPDHPFFLGTQPHPEYKSRFERPSPVFVSFIRAASR